ncbi:MAG: DUF488 domain-containing protein, partial [Candidatus Micrarchaeaceae archaeon]
GLMTKKEAFSRSGPQKKRMFTIGYSLRSIGTFLQILSNHGVKLLVDVRTIPKSRHKPEFNKERLSKALQRHGISYMHMKELGGLRKPLKNSINAAWRNESFRGFADYMQTKDFAAAIARLESLASRKTVAVMCAEGNPFRCHRSLIADAMVVRGYKVYEITGKNAESVKEHKITGFAKVRGKKITYPQT